MRVPALLCLASVAASQKTAEDYRVKSLYGYPGTLPEMYAGKLVVDAAHGRELFFWYVPASESPETSPVITWFTGGPGCSSIDALLAENGPFWPNAEGTLTLNPAAWSRVAHMLWIDSPAGVGFSTTKNTSDYNVGDARTRRDAYVAVQGFFDLFPHLSRQKFFVSGESYGGHYVPNLAAEVIIQNGLVPGNGFSRKINIGGFLVGNPWTDPTFDNTGAADFWYYHGIISTQQRKALNVCPWAGIGPLATDDAACTDAVNSAMAQFEAVDIYDVYADVCVGAPPVLAARAGGARRAAQHLKAVFGAEAPPAPTCIDEYVTTYLNRADVQASLNIPPTPWSICSSVVNYSQADLLTSMLPVYKFLLGHALVDRTFKMLVYSGDIDGIVPFTGTRSWVEALSLPLVSSYQPWLLDNQTGGWTVSYADRALTFETVRGAGHMVPGTQPDRAFSLLTRFLALERL